MQLAFLFKGEKKTTCSRHASPLPLPCRLCARRPNGERLTRRARRLRCCSRLRRWMCRPDFILADMRMSLQSAARAESADRPINIYIDELMSFALPNQCI